VIFALIIETRPFKWIMGIRTSLRQSLDRLKLFPVITSDQSFVCKINVKTRKNPKKLFIAKMLVLGLQFCKSVFSDICMEIARP
jgi:hypothetical protein